MAISLGTMPPATRDLWERLNRTSPTYLVGGAVRDLLRGTDPHDWDLATAVTPDNLDAWATARGIRVLPTGKAYGTMTLQAGREEWVQVTTFRQDGRYADGRRPQTVTFAERIEEDLARRDFTMNAMALTVDGTLIDPYGGRLDLQSGLVRAVGNPSERFNEDPLRMWRAVRFLGVAGLTTLEPVTKEAIYRHRARLIVISMERQREELWRLLHLPHTTRALEAANDLGLLSLLWPEWAATVHFDQRNPHHRYPLHQHLLTAACLGDTPILRLTGLLHDIAKPQTLTITDGIGHFYDHADVGAVFVRHMLERTKFDRATIDHVATLVEWHMFPWDDAGPKALRRALRTLGPSLVNDLLALRRMDTLATGMGDWTGEADTRARIAAVIEETPQGPRLAISGRDVMAWTGMGAGQQIGAILRQVQDWVDEEPTRNERATLAAFVQAMKKGGSQ